MGFGIKSLNFALLAAFSFTASLAQASTLKSTIPGISIKNAHVVIESRDQGKILRGSEPGSLTSELADYGVSKVLIFKNETKTEVRDEQARLEKLNIPSEHIPFRWKDFNAQEACEQTIQALRFIKSAYQDKKSTLYFHCTMGEDRTGYLAGLFSMITEGKSTRQAFDEDLCEHGYEAGDPGKPRNVVAAVRKELTPLFVKMAELIETKKISLRSLNSAICADVDLRNEELLKKSNQYQCK